VQNSYDTRALAEADRILVNYIMHAIASNTLAPDHLRAAIFRVHELGFIDLAKRIERRVGRWIATAYEDAPRAAPPIVEEQKIEPLPFALTEGQENAAAAVRRIKSKSGYGLCVIAGFAGVGKTTLIRALAAEHGTPIVITPTGKAALRVREATSLHAETIHRWIYKPKEDEKTGTVRFVRRLPDDIAVPRSRLVILDEASMVSPELWKDVNTICTQLGLCLVLIGDGFQLPPVLPPNSPPFSVLLPEFAAAWKAERIEMTEVLRQAQGSPVIRASMGLRNGLGIRALAELPRLDTSQLWGCLVETYRNGGVTICHRNVTRFQLNAGARAMLGIYDEMPQKGEPLMVLKNAYEAGVMNGESFAFEGWSSAPESYERVFDKYKPVEEDARFGATKIGKATVTIALEELHGRLTAGPKAIEIAASNWARMQGVYLGDSVAPHVHVNFGYAWTSHKSQGSQWPFVLVIVEPSVRLNEEDGRRWMYTSLTRAQTMAAVYIGKI
jgi:exodeoxyribonuclease-5